MVVVVIAVGAGEGVKKKTKQIFWIDRWCVVIEQNIEEKHEADMHIVKAKGHHRIEACVGAVQENSHQ